MHTYFARPRLTELLGVPGETLAPLTVVSGPIGYGKTVLLNQWVDSLPAGVECMRISAGEGESSLFAHLAGEVTDGASRSLDGGAAVLSWVASLRTPTVVVIDDYEKVTSADLDMILVELLRSSSNLYLVVAGRGFSVLDTALVSTRINCLLIDGADLAFTEAELQQVDDAFLASNGGVIAAAAGWPRLTSALARFSRGDTSPQQVLATEVRALLTDETQARILQFVEHLESVTADILAEVCGLPKNEVDDHLEQLRQLGLVRCSMKGASEQYRASPIVTSLRHELWDTPVPDEELSRAVVANASAQANHDVPAALRTLLSARLTSDAENFATTYFLLLMAQPTRTFKLLEEYADQLGTEMPVLQSLRLAIGQAHVGVDLETLFRWAEQLRESEWPEHSDHQDAAAVYVEAMFIATRRILTDWEIVGSRAAALEAALAEHEFRGIGEHWSVLPLVYSILALTGLLTGQLEMAARSSQQALTAATREENPGEQIRAHNMLALLAARSGKIVTATEHLSESERIQDMTGTAAPELSYAHAAVAKGTVHLARGDLEACEQALASVQDDLGRMESWLEYVLLESWVTRLKTGNQAALEKLEKRVRERTGASLSSFGSAQLAAMLGNLTIYNGDLVAAETLLAASPVQDIDEVRLSQARLALMRGDWSETHRIVSVIPHEGADRATTSTAVLMQAAALMSAGDPSAALARLADLEVDVEAPRLQLLLSTVPYGLLRELAVAAHEAGQPELLEAVDALPQLSRFVSPEPLSPAEQRTLEVVASCSTVQQAADELHLSMNTVKSHLRRIYAKLRVNSRKQLVAVAKRRGLL